MSGEEYYIEDRDLIDLLKDVLGDKISDKDIERILAASDDGQITEEDFDNLVDDIIKSSKTSDSILDSPEPIDPSKHIQQKLIYLSNSTHVCPICGSSLLDDSYCANCNLKFSFVSHDDENPSKK